MKLYDFGILAIIAVLLIGVVTGAEIQNEKHIIPAKHTQQTKGK